MSETAAHVAAITRIVKPVNSGAPGLASDSAELSHGTTTQAPRNRTGKIVGGVIGGVVGLLLLLGLLYWLLRRQRRSRATKDGHKEIINDPEAASTAAPTPQQKNSVDQPPQIAQVQSAVVQRPAPAVTAPIAALLPAPMSLTIPQSPTMPSSTLSPDTALSAPHPNDAWRPTSPVSSRGHARSPSINSVISDYVDADEYAATPISANYVAERRYAEAQGNAFYSSSKSIRSMTSQNSLRAPSPCRSARYKSLDGAVLDEADLRLLRPVERGESGFFTH